MEQTRQLLHEVLEMFKDREAAHQLEVEEFRRVFAEQKSHHEQEVSEMHALLLESEKRIKSTNEMVFELSRTISSLKETYTYHLDQAVSSRNSIIEQNRQLMERMSAAEDMLKQERERCERLMRDVLEISCGHGMSVNIKQ